MLPGLAGYLRMGSQQSCEKMKEVGAKPTLFWRLVPTVQAHSIYTDNDILKQPIDKELFTCNPGQQNNLVITICQYLKEKQLG